MSTASDPAPSPPIQPSWWLPQLQFSLRTLVIGMLLIGSAGGLWWRWEPWQLEWSVGAGASDSSDWINSILYTPDEKHLIVLIAKSEKLPVTVKNPVTVEARLINPPTVKMFNAQSGALEWSYTLNGPFSENKIACALSPGGRWVCVGRMVRGIKSVSASIRGGATWMVTLLDAETGRKMNLPESLFDPLSELNPGPRVGLDTADVLMDRVTFADDDSWVAIGWKGEVHIFSPNDGAERAILDEQCDEAVPLHFYSGFKKILVVHRTLRGNVHRIWDVDSKQILKSIRANDGVVDLDEDGNASSEESNDEFEEHFKALKHKARTQRPSQDWGHYAQGRDVVVASNLRVRLKRRDANGQDADPLAVDPLSGEVVQELDNRIDAHAPVPVISSDDHRIASVDGHNRIRVWSCNRPFYWWGVAWLPEFWLTVLFAGALGWSVWRDGRMTRKKSEAATG